MQKALGSHEDVRRISCFQRKHWKEVAFLWRLHPLIKVTIESMRPERWEGYEKLVEDYREKGWGIYNDTTDMNRVLAKDCLKMAEEKDREGRLSCKCLGQEKI